MKHEHMFIYVQIGREMEMEMEMAKAKQINVSNICGLPNSASSFSRYKTGIYFINRVVLALSLSK